MKPSLIEHVFFNHTQAKKYDRAIAILAKHGWWDKLILVVRDVPKDDKKNLGTCVNHFRKVRPDWKLCVLIKSCVSQMRMRTYIHTEHVCARIHISYYV